MLEGVTQQLVGVPAFMSGTVVCMYTENTHRATLLSDVSVETHANRSLSFGN